MISIFDIFAIIYPVCLPFISGRPSGQVTFPVDYFEPCHPMNDVEYGGNDLLQIYNVQQIKNRLNTTGMYVASTKVSLGLIING